MLKRLLACITETAEVDAPSRMGRKSASMRVIFNGASMLALCGWTRVLSAEHGGERWSPCSTKYDAVAINLGYQSNFILCTD